MRKLASKSNDIAVLTKIIREMTDFDFPYLIEQHAETFKEYIFDTESALEDVLTLSDNLEIQITLKNLKKIVSKKALKSVTELQQLLNDDNDFLLKVIYRKVNKMTKNSQMECKGGGAEPCNVSDETMVYAHPFMGNLLASNTYSS